MSDTLNLFGIALTLHENHDLNHFRRRSHDSSYIKNEAGQIIGINIRNNETLSEVLVPKELSHLQYLNLSDNEQLISLTFKQALPELFHFDISDSNVQLLVFESGFQKLRWLDASRNKMKSIELKGDMPELLYLDLAGNELQSFYIPVIFEKLEYLYLIESTPENLPKEVYDGKKNCWQDVRNYFRAALQSGEVLNTEAKFIFFGNGRAGKTTLSHQLRNGKFDATIDSTHGILVDEWVIPKEDFPTVLTHKFKSEINKHQEKKRELLELPEQVLLNVWDFGGQEYFHATHRLFLNNNVMYLVVWEEGTNQQNEEKGEYPYTYWQKNIDHYAEKKLTLLLQNKETGSASFDFEQLKYKVARRNEADGSSVAKYELDVETLKKEILKQLPKLDYLGVPMATLYDDIRRELKNRRKQKPFMYFSDFKGLCQQMDKTRDQIMQNDSDIESITKFLHETGALICYRFKKDKTGKKLDDYVFIDPKWVTNTIYQILDQGTREKFGEFDKKHVVEVLNKFNNPVKDADLWLDLMTEFELIFKKQNTDNVYIAPQFLNPECLDLSEKAMANYYNDMPHKLILHYPEFLPRSIISRFICKYGNLAKDYYWKYGIIVHKDGDKSMVVCDYENHQIIIHSQNRLSDLDVELFNTLRALDDFENLEVLVTEVSDVTKTIGPVGIQKLDNQISRGRKFVEWKDQEFAVAPFEAIFVKGDIGHKIKIVMPDFEVIKGEVRNLIGQGKLEKAIELLEENLSGDRKDESTQLKNNLSALSKDVRMGIVSRSDSNRERNQISFAALELVKFIEESTESISGTIQVNGPFVPEVDTQKAKTILFTAANPSTAARIATDVEHRTIKEEIIKGERGLYQFLEPHLAVRISDLIRAFHNKPEIIHFSGHGEVEGIILTDDQNKELPLSMPVIKRLFKPLVNHVKLVFLNACLSSEQAMMISSMGDIIVIGNNRSIGDGAAISFAKGFYTGLSLGKTYEEAFNDGMTILMAESPDYMDAVEVWKGGEKLDW